MAPAVTRTLTCLAALTAAGPAAAHGPLLIGPADLAMAATFDATVIVPLLLAHWAYGRWILGRVSRRCAACFFGGEAALVLALVWPLAALGETLVSAHVAQHLLLASVAPPLLLKGMPRGAWTVRPALAAGIFAAVLWAWHMPPMFQAAAYESLPHSAEHASLFLAGLVFWSSLLGTRRHGPWPAVTACLCLALGALLALAGEPLYPMYGDAASLWGLSATEDQALAGLLIGALGLGVALAARRLPTLGEYLPGARNRP